MIVRVPGGAVRVPFAIVPLGAASETRLLLAARGLRAVGDGFVSLEQAIGPASRQARKPIDEFKEITKYL